MDRSPGFTGLSARNNMDGTLRDIVMFKESNNESVEFESWKGDTYKLVKIPTGVDEKIFYKTAKRMEWIEQTLKASLVDGSLDDAFRCMLEYMLTWHPEMA